MKFYATLLALVSAVVAQSAQIGAPQEGSSVAAGSNFTMTIVTNSLSGSQEVAIAIGLASCGDTTCPDTKSKLGDILYQGPFTPQYAAPPGSLPPHQNFSLQVPGSFAVGKATLGVAQFSLVGAVLAPSLDTFNTTLIITNATSGAGVTARNIRSMRIFGNRST